MTREAYDAKGTPNSVPPGRQGAESACRKFLQPWHVEPHESLETCGPAASWCRLQDEEFFAGQQPQLLAGEAAHNENAEGLTHRSSTHIADARTPPRRKIREKLGASELTLCTTSPNLPHKRREQPRGNH
jgi:hypothetical protein